MSEMPERIWAWKWELVDRGLWDSSDLSEHANCHEYIRADIAARIRAEVVEECARAAEKLSAAFAGQGRPDTSCGAYAVSIVLRALTKEGDE